MDNLEQKIKEKLLESLIEHMQDKMGGDLDKAYPKKALEVSVAAPDKEHLAQGLDKAKELAQSSDLDSHDADSHGDDEHRLMALLGKDDDEDEDEDDEHSI